jgi:hypothetical protein
MHLNSVSDGSVMVVLADGTELFRTNLPNLDGTYSVNNEYNLDIPVNVPAGKHLITVTNAGTDWFYLDWAQLERVLPSTYASNWVPSPEAIGLRGPRESLLYVVAPFVSFPGNATNANLPVQQGQTITLSNWPAGTYDAEWYDPATAALLGYSQASATGNNLTLSLPDFTEDLAGILYAPPSLSPLGLSPSNGFQFQLNSETGGKYRIEKSTNLSTWATWLTVTNETGVLGLMDPAARTNPRAFFRAKQDR